MHSLNLNRLSEYCKKDGSGGGNNCGEKEVRDESFKPQGCGRGPEEGTGALKKKRMINVFQH